MPARQEHSAGVILFRVGRGGEAEYLLLDYGRHWDYPKGHVENGEDDLGAAVRELGEETGITDARPVEGFVHDLAYFFRAKGSLVRKTVRFFLARAGSGAEVRLSHEHTGHAFLPYEAAMERVTFKSSREVLKAAHAYLQAHSEHLG